MNDEEKARLAALGERMKDVSAIRRRSQAWVEAGRPGVFSQTEVIQRIEELEYALKSFAQFYAAHDCKLARPSEPHADWFAIVDRVFARGGALGLMELSNITAADREALLLEMAMRDQEQSAEIGSLRADALSWREHIAKISCPACGQRNPVEGDWFEDHEYPCWVCGVMLTPRMDPEDGSWAFPRADDEDEDPSKDPDQPGVHGEGTYP